MKKQKAIELRGEILPYLPEFRMGGNKLLVIKPIGFVLRGLLIEDSSDANSFYFHQFYMPICHSIDHLTLSYGSRIETKSGNSSWDANNPFLALDLLEAISEQALPKLLKLNSAQDVIRDLKIREGSRFYPLRDIGYLQILIGEYPTASKTLLKFVNMYKYNVNRDWEVRVLEEVCSIISLLQRDQKSALEQVRYWQNETISNLKLEKLR